MSVSANEPQTNIWNVICQEFATQRKQYDADRIVKEDYETAKLSPGSQRKLYSKVDREATPLEGSNSGVGYSSADPVSESPPPKEQPLPNPKTCSPRDFLEAYIFPVLLPAMEEMLKQAKLEKCFERKRTKFNALDFLTEYLYRRNKTYDEREDVELLDIPFVQEWLKEHPRPPLPKSLLWSEEEAALIIQSFWRGYKVRVEPNIQELRQWQREWREENENISQKVSDFWDKQMPDGAEDTTQASSDQLPSVKSAPTISVPDALADDIRAEAEDVKTDDRETKENTVYENNNNTIKTPSVTVENMNDQDLNDINEDVSNNKTLEKDVLLAS